VEERPASACAELRGRNSRGGLSVGTHSALVRNERSIKARAYCVHIRVAARCPSQNTTGRLEQVRWEENECQ
jgi:hypothetical protein